MKKRPILFVSIIIVLIIIFLKLLCNIDFLYDMPSSQKGIIIYGKIYKIEEKSSGYLLFLQQSEYIKISETVQKKTGIGRVILKVDSDSYAKKDFKIGQKIEAEARYDNFNVARNFGNFDEEKYYHSLGISGRFLPINGSESIKIPYPDKYNHIRQKLYEFRCLLSNSFKEMSQKHAGIFNAIVTGDRSILESDTKELYQKNGIAHILAISGLHISLIGITIFYILRKKCSFLISAFITTIIMILFCIMSGESPSALRATIMFVVKMIALCFGKRYDFLTAISLSGIIILCTNPCYLFNTGFLLSFGAVLGVAVFQEGIFKFTVKGNVPKIASNRMIMWVRKKFSNSAKLANFFIILYKKNKIRKNSGKVIGSFFTSIFVSLTTLPIIIMSYYEIPLYSILLNVIVIPLMSVVLAGGILGGLGGIISIILGRFFAGFGAYVISLIELLCMILHEFPYNTLITGNPSLIRVFLYYTIFLTLAIIAKNIWKMEKDAEIKRKISVKKKSGIVLLVIMSMLIILLGKTQDNNISITFFDVDQGKSILIENTDNTNILIDGGSTGVSDLYKWRLEDAIKYKGVSKLNYVFVSHCDTDHVSAIMEILEKQKDGNSDIIIENIGMAKAINNENYNKLISLCKECAVNVIDMYSGIKVNYGETLIKCLYPDKNSLGTIEGENNSSLVLKLEFGNFNALFTGDIEKEGENILIKNKIISSKVSYDLLDVAHHGSRGSSSYDFINLINPKISIVSAGVNNSYGHPHKEVIERLEAAGSKIYVTSNCGQVIIKADKEGNMKIETKL